MQHQQGVIQLVDYVCLQLSQLRCSSCTCLALPGCHLLRVLLQYCCKSSTNNSSYNALPLCCLCILHIVIAL
jgi:hypothetical protein